MPTYEYACSNCDTTHEVQQKMTDPTLTECPSCHQATLRKLFTNVGVVFKGSGFYRTDSRESGTKDSGTKGSGSSTSTDASGTSSSKDSGSSGSGAGTTTSAGSSGSSSSTSSSGSSTKASAPA